MLSPYLGGLSEQVHSCVMKQLQVFIHCWSNLVMESAMLQAMLQQFGNGACIAAGLSSAAHMHVMVSCLVTCCSCSAKIEL